MYCSMYTFSESVQGSAADPDLAILVSEACEKRRGRVMAWPTLRMPCKFYFILFITFSGCNHYFAALPFHRPKRKIKSKSKSMNLE